MRGRRHHPRYRRHRPVIVLCAIPVVVVVVVVVTVVQNHFLPLLEHFVVVDDDVASSSPYVVWRRGIRYIFSVVCVVIDIGYNSEEEAERLCCWTERKANQSTNQFKQLGSYLEDNLM